MTDLPHPDNPGQTHFEGCWRHAGHHNCAIDEIERLQKKLTDSQETNIDLDVRLTVMTADRDLWRKIATAQSVSIREALKEGLLQLGIEQ